jgi:hypothetical protein
MRRQGAQLSNAVEMKICYKLRKIERPLERGNSLEIRVKQIQSNPSNSWGGKPVLCEDAAKEFSGARLRFAWSSAEAPCRVRQERNAGGTQIHPQRHQQESRKKKRGAGFGPRAAGLGGGRLKPCCGRQCRRCYEQPVVEPQVSIGCRPEAGACGHPRA